VRSRALAALLLTGALVLSGCGSSDDGDGGNDTATLHVLAAASLTETFTSLAKDFEKDHPGTTVKLAFDSSATLAEQVNQGAPADVLATADERTMTTVVDGNGTKGQPRLFATNHLQLVVPPDNPAHLTSFQDLAKPGVKYVVCVDSAPCGKLAATVLDAAGITAKPVSEEVDVKAVLSKVQLDEADAGLVYATDAVAARGKVSAIDIPSSGDTLNSYPVAALSGAKEPTLARAFVRLVLSARGQKVLADAGFGAP
jgi:molybdate transport system substrate-binding protein